MKKFGDFLKEQPTNHGGNPQAYSNAADAAGPVAGVDLKLFKGDNDLLSQDYQTPGEDGLAKYRFASIYPVEKLSLSQIDSMVKASDEFTNLMDKNTQDHVKKSFASFMEDTKPKSCPSGQYYCYTDKKCKKIPKGYYAGRGGYLRPDPNNNGDENGKNGNGSNGHSNGNGSGNGGNGNGGGGNGSGGNGGGGNGGGNGGGGGGGNGG